MLNYKKIDGQSTLRRVRYAQGLTTLAGAAIHLPLGVMVKPGTVKAFKVAQIAAGLNGTSWAAHLYKQLKNDGKAAPMWGGTAATAAQAKVTFSGVVATDVVTINGQALTCVASGANNVQFNVGATDAESMANFVAKVNSTTDSDILNKVTATDNGDATCQLTALTSAWGGHGGNFVALAKTDGHSGSSITLSDTVFGSGTGAVLGTSLIALTSTAGEITLAARSGKAADSEGHIASQGTGVTAPVLTTTVADLRFEAGDALSVIVTPSGTYSSTLPSILLEASVAFDL